MGYSTLFMSSMMHAFDFLRWRLFSRFGALELFEVVWNDCAKIVTSQQSWVQSQYRLMKLGDGR